MTRSGTSPSMVLSSSLSFEYLLGIGTQNCLIKIEETEKTSRQLNIESKWCKNGWWDDKFVSKFMLNVVSLKYFGEWTLWEINSPISLNHLNLNTRKLFRFKDSCVELSVLLDSIGIEHFSWKQKHQHREHSSNQIFCSSRPITRHRVTSSLHALGPRQWRRWRSERIINFVKPIVSAIISPCCNYERAKSQKP